MDDWVLSFILIQKKKHGEYDTWGRCLQGYECFEDDGE